MEKPSIPKVFPISKGRYVNVPYESFNELCSTINSIIDTVNLQSETISKLYNDTDLRLKALDVGIKSQESNMAKLAEIVEEIYENLE